VSSLVLATSVLLASLAPRPTEPSQPTSPPASDTARDDADSDTVPGAETETPMTDAELEKLSVSIDDPMVIEAAPPVAHAQADTEHPLEHKASDRSVDATFPPKRPPKETCPTSEAGLPSTAALAPRLIEPRWEPGAALLGGLVGFGTGHFYANSPNRGLVMGITDTLLLGGLAGSIWALNEHVVREDRRTGLSLSRGQRDRDGSEKALTGLAWGLGIAAGVSRIFQAFDAYHAAKHTNEELRNVSFVPLATVAPTQGGGQLALGFTW
jgi:hypothetical protein